MARTGQDLLNLMEVLFPEAQLQAGETGVTKALIALNSAQQYFEALMANRAEIMGDNTGNISTTASQEYSTWPAGLLRLDGLQFIDSVTGRPVWDLEPIRKTGGHITTPGWPYNVLNYVSATGGGGKPVAYFTDARKIYWVPQPDAVYTIRWYGLQAAADITASGTFSYDDRAMLPMAVFAVRILRTGLDDPIENYAALASEVFKPVLDMLANFKRERASGFQYRYAHNS